MWKDVARPIGQVATFGAVAGIVGMAAIAQFRKSRMDKKHDEKKEG